MKTRSGTSIDSPLDLHADVCIVGSGAGGSVLAAQLTEAGLDVIVLEAGGSHSSADFQDVSERWSYPTLYQERGARGTIDRGITILQGRAVGGGTLINWTTCFRTPERILALWRREHGAELSAEVLRPHFEAVEQRLHITEWPSSMANPNNNVLRAGCEALGLEWTQLKRNVAGCANSGFCGLGCPVQGKQAMHLTYLKDATLRGARVFSDVKVKTLVTTGNAVTSVNAVTMVHGADREAGVPVRVRAKVVVCSGGAINTPALLLRSGLGQGGLVGRRTFFHPVVAIVGEYAEQINPFYGAPQSIGSHAFIDRGADEYGYFLECAPMQPMLSASAGWSSGLVLAEFMKKLPHLSTILALHVDGVLSGDEGGTVTVDSGGRPQVSYPIGPRLQAAFAHAHYSVAKLHLAAGALSVRTTHLDPVVLRAESDLPKLTAAKFGNQEHGIFTAHQLGGCGFGSDPARHVLTPELEFRGLKNLFVVDGSALPTSLGVNPSQTIYGMAHWASQFVVAKVRALR